MTQNAPPAPFERKETVDKPGIIGARWWQESIAVPRRQAMTGILAVGGVIAAMAALGTCVVAAKSVGSSEPDVSFQPKSSLDMQKEYGWDFGATGESLVFNGQTTQSFDRAALRHIAEDLSPASSKYTPFFVPTLFQSPTALRKTTPAGETDGPAFRPLGDVLVPISTPSMTTAFEQGKTLAALLERDPRASESAIIVDLPGPEAVAFAAGASGAFDPVFLFDNWPHPRGVVPAHLTLAAAAYYQPMFVKARAGRATTARPMFVLDRKRLSPYTDDASQFDNRHIARVPSASALRTIGVKDILYVGPSAVEKRELDDLADDLLAYSSEKMPLRLVPATAFETSPSQLFPSPPVEPTPEPSRKPSSPAGSAAPPLWAGPYFYGGSASAHASFWTHWASTPSSAVLSTNELQPYTPVARTTPYSSGLATSTAASRPRPTNFGMVPVAIAVGSGIILGAKLSRSGSWNRTSYGSSGGG